MKQIADELFLADHRLRIKRLKNLAELVVLLVEWVVYDIIGTRILVCGYPSLD